MHPQVERRRHPDASAAHRVVGHRRDDGGAPAPAVAHVPGEQHRVLAGGVDVESALDGGVEVRGLLGASVAGVLVERGVHAHAVAPGDEVGVRLRAPGLDALGLAAAQRIAPDELLDGLRPQLQGEGVIDRREGRIRDRVHDRRRYGMRERVRRWGGRFEVRHGATGCAGIGVAEGVAPIMCMPRRSGPQTGGAAPSHGEGGGTRSMGMSASIARQSTSTIAAAAAESHRTMAPWSR